MKKFLICFLILLINSPAFADLTYKEINSPQKPAYRFGMTEEPENEYVEAKKEAKEEAIDQAVARIEKNASTDDALTYADLSIKRISKEISDELKLDEKEMMGDLSMLWQGAAQKSDTINFALYKLSNPDEDKPDEKSIKKVLTTIASMSTLVGAGVGNPILATGSMLGSNLLSIMGQDTKALNYKYTKVNDADMIILVRKVEELQQKTVNLYYDYMTSRERFNMAAKITQDRKKNYEQSQNMSREVILVTDAYYRTALDAQMKAKSDFYAKRASLEQFVGTDTMIVFEKEIKHRESKRK